MTGSTYTPRGGRPSALHSVLIDIDGVLCIGPAPIPGAAAAMNRLRRTGAGIRFITNTTRRTRVDIVAQLRGLGFDCADDEVVTGALAARGLIERRGLRPLLLIHPGLMPEFADIETRDPNAVLIGDAGDGFSYETLNRAFRVLIGQPGAPLIALANNRYFREASGLSLDAGPFVAALECAAGIRAEITGKPAEAIFRTALDALHSSAGDAVMIGDDIEGDIGGAQRIGMEAILVRTGKYRPADEAHPTIHPDAIADDFGEAIDRHVLPRLRRAPRDQGRGCAAVDPAAG